MSIYDEAAAKQKSNDDEKMEEGRRTINLDSLVAAALLANEAFVVDLPLDNADVQAITEGALEANSTNDKVPGILLHILANGRLKFIVMV